MPYDTRVDGNNIVVMLGSCQSHHERRLRRQPALRRRQQRQSSGARAIRSIDFRRGADGAGRIIVKLTDPHTPINLHQIGNQIVVDFSGADLPKNLMRRYDAADFRHAGDRLRRDRASAMAAAS